MVGPSGAAGRRTLRSVSSRVLISLFVAIFAFSGTPAAAWAEAAQELAGTGVVQAGSDGRAGASDGALDRDAAGNGGASTGDGSDAGSAGGPADAAGEDAADGSVTAPADPDQPVAGEPDGDRAGSSSDVAPGRDGGAEPEADASKGDEAGEQQVKVSVEVIGPDASGAPARWAAAADYELAAGSTAATASEAAFKKAGLIADYGETSWGWSLTSITSPYTGKALAWDSSTNAYWQLFVNGELSQVGAGSHELKAGDEIAWVYGSDGTIPPVADRKLSVEGRVIGIDANGNAEDWVTARSLEVESGSTAADFSEALFGAAGIEADYGESSWGWSLNTVTSPYSGAVLGYDQATGRFWALFVNGEMAQVGAGSYELKAGDSITWCYTAGTELPGDDAPVIDPAAPRPSIDASWSGFGNGGSATITNVPTPSDSASAAWTADLKAEGESYTSVGDPIIAGDAVYATTSTDLVKIARTTGKIEKRVKTGGKTSYFSRPVYAAGLIIVPSDDGSVAAFTADELVCVWRTAPLEKPVVNGKPMSYQANSTMTVAGGSVIVPFVAGAGSSGAASAGALVCVRISDGSVLWTKETVKDAQSAGEGYYWAGAAVSGDGFVIGDEGGRIMLKSAATGDTVSSVDVGMPIRSTVVPAGTEGGKPAFLVVGRKPATLFKIVRDGDALVLAGSCAFTATSTSTPAVAGGKAYVGGIDGESWTSHGVLAVIDLATMTVDDRYVTQSSGEVKASPLVSVQGGDTYVYFTCNNNPGALYRYTAGTHEVAAIFTPEAAQQNYCTASVVADADGNLYYSNDSGTLFALSAAPGYTVTFDAQGGASVPAARPVQGRPMVRPADPVREGYTFEGWHRDAAGTLAWDFSSPVIGDMTLYAKWSPITRTVRFDAAGGSAVAPQAVAPGSAVTRPADPVRTGYAFGGWFADAALTRAWDFSEPVTRNLTLYAKWTALPGQPGGVPQGRPGTPLTGGSGTAPTTPGAGTGGFVPAARRPVSTAVTASAGVAGDAGAADGQAPSTMPAADGKGAADDAAGSSASGLSGGAKKAKAAVSTGVPGWIAPVAGALGVIGLFAAGIWFALLRRRGE